jgi:hypothetical protein
VKTWVRQSWAVAVTLVVHGLLLWGVAPTGVVPPSTSRRVAAHSWVLVEVPPPPPVESLPSAPVHKQFETRKAAVRGGSGGERMGPETSKAPVGSDRPVRESSSAGVSLLPSLGGISGLLPTPAPGFGGTTVRNTPEERGDPAVIAEYQGEVTKRRVDGLLGQGAGAAAVATGNVDPYFGAVVGRMRRALAHAAVPSSLTAGLPPVVQSYGAMAQAFARGELNEPVAANPPMANGLHAGNVDLQRQMEGMALSGKMTARIAGGSQVVVLEAVVELEHVGGGAVALANVVRSSGAADFDELALHHAKKGFLGPENGPDSGVGADGESFRSFWRFTWQPPHVRVELLRLEAGGRHNPFVGSP